jgi:CRISPR-associated protein Cmr3
MANYKIKLTPVDYFFFGGEKHSINKKTGEPESNYYVESNPYPQQTTLLGLIRYYLLLKNNDIFNGNKITDKGKASEFIGDCSFDYNQKTKKYGKIISLSGLYFCNGENNYFFAPLDIDFTIKNFLLFKEDKIYNAKDHYDEICQQIFNENGEIIKLSEIVKDSPRVGNEKSEKGESKEDKFYKQNFKSLSSGWGFCVDAEIEDGAGVPENDSLFVPFGGEKSFFKMEVSRLEPAKFKMPDNLKKNLASIICMSDCMVDSSILNHSKIAVTRYVSFRNLKSSVKDTEKYSGLSDKDSTQLNRGSRYNLLMRGSVLYFEDNEKLEKAEELISNQSHCKIIGFNDIITNKL